MCICFLCHQLYLHLLSLKTRHQLWTFEDLESIFDSLCSTFDKKCRYYLNTAISHVKKDPRLYISSTKIAKEFKYTSFFCFKSPYTAETSLAFISVHSLLQYSKEDYKQEGIIKYW